MLDARNDVSKASAEFRRCNEAFSCNYPLYTSTALHHVPGRIVGAEYLNARKPVRNLIMARESVQVAEKTERFAKLCWVSVTITIQSIKVKSLWGRATAAFSKHHTLPCWHRRQDGQGF